MPRLAARWLLIFVIGASAAFQLYTLLNRVLEGEGTATDLIFGLNALALLVLVLRALADTLRE
jgi:hypothetical protein